nr:hypothetical protein [Mycoplasmopsis bovis]
MGLFDYLAAIPVGMVIWMPIMAIALLFATFFVYALLVAEIHCIWRNKIFIVWP